MIRNLGFKGLHKKKLVLTGEIDKKLKENENIPLEEILSEDTVVDEIQNKNKLLYKYLNKEKVRQMVDYIIKEPPSDTTHDIGYKFPWICSQIFNVEDRIIMKYFLKTNFELANEKIEEENNDNNDNNDLYEDVEMEDENKNEDSKENEDTNNKYDNNKNNNEDNSGVNINEQNNKNLELFDYLLTFLDNDSELNYVLCGYFASLLKNLLNMEYTLIMKYLYLEKKDSIEKMINHSYRYSISEMLTKILIYNTNDEELNSNDEIPIIRMELLEKLFDKIDIDMDTEKFYSITTLGISFASYEGLLNDIMNNKKIMDCLILNQLRNLNLLIINNKDEEIIINRRRNFNSLIDIIISWINAINNFDISIPTTENENLDNIDDISYNHTLLSYELFCVLKELIRYNFNKTNINSGEQQILQCFDDKPLLPLGLYRIKIVELLGNLFIYFKNIPSLYDKLLIDSQFFENAFTYLFEYEFNNIYQDALLFLFKQFFNYSGSHEMLAEHLFEKLNLIDIIISHLKDIEILDSDILSDRTKYIYKSGNMTNHGYIAFLYSLSYKLNTIVGGDPLKINSTLSREGSMTFMTRATPFVGKEEIDNYYGMDSNELYDEVEDDTDDKKPKFNKPVKSMEKYLNDKWNEFFYDNISENIKLYETKLLKEDPNKEKTLFHNPFIVEDSSEIRAKEMASTENGDEDIDFLAKERKKLNYGQELNKMLYEDNENPDADMDINMNNNRFKMSMRNAYKNDNIIQKEEQKEQIRGSMVKMCVDEMDEGDNNDKK